MRNFLLIIGIFLLIFGLWSCRPTNKSISWFDQTGRPKVLSTTAMIDDLVKQIGKDFIDTTALIQGQVDPHSYELVKGDAEKIAFADLIFFNGLGLEHGASLQYQLLHSQKAIALGKLLDESELIKVNGILDPHIWMDAKLFAALCEPIAYHLGKLDPKHRQQYYANAKKVREKLLNVHLTMEKMLKEIPEQKRFLVTTHDAFRYFVRAYLATEAEKGDGSWQNRLASPEGLAPEGQISPLDIERITNFVAKNQIDIVFAETNLSKNALRKVIDVAGQKGKTMEIANDALYGDVMRESYVDTLLYNAKILQTTLGKE